MPLQKITTTNHHFDTADIIGYFNQLTDYCNELERRLAEVEKPVERIKSETRPAGEYEPQTLQEDAEEDERLATDREMCHRDTFKKTNCTCCKEYDDINCTVHQ